MRFSPRNCRIWLLIAWRNMNDKNRDILRRRGFSCMQIRLIKIAFRRSLEVFQSVIDELII